MADTLEFYLKCAEEAAAEARATTLDNVRERALRSEAAWRSMARRKLAVVEQRRVAAEQRIQPGEG